MEIQAYDQNELIQALADGLNDLIAGGFILPFYASIVALNGYIITAKYIEGTEGLDVEFLGEISTDDGLLQVPINIMFVDARGEAARMVIDKLGKHKLLH